MAKFSDIPPFIPGGEYISDISLGRLEGWLEEEEHNQKVDIDPDFQRGRCWTDEQSILYVEFLLRGGQSSYTLQWNHPSYHRSKEKYSDLPETLVLVDGKQRLTACLRFMRGEIPVFGHFLKEYDDPVDRRCALGIAGVRLRMAVNNLQTRKELLTWYLSLNDGGVVHTKEEIARVKELLAKEI